MTTPSDPYGEPVRPDSPYGSPSYPPPAGGPVPPPQAGGYHPLPYPRNDLAVWSLALGIAAFVLSCGLFTGIPAIILGTKARRAVETGEADNGGMATAGIVLGWIAVGASVLAVLVLALVVPSMLLSFGALWSIPDQP
ncbi:DUF4190 domain-containing protein [Cellulosimicrobium terreum]|nr:DUF4190 domain-containing protein [Cellulosimicrobium terreum]